MRKMIGPLLLTAIAATAVPATAQQLCADRAAITKTLEQSYGEKFAGGGVRNESSLFEVWSSDDGETWTILMTRADGTSCVMATGTDWRGVLPAASPDGVPG